MVLPGNPVRRLWEKWLPVWSSNAPENTSDEREDALGALVLFGDFGPQRWLFFTFPAGAGEEEVQFVERGDGTVFFQGESYEADVAPVARGGHAEGLQHLTVPEIEVGPSWIPDVLVAENVAPTGRTQQHRVAYGLKLVERMMSHHEDGLAVRA